MRARLAAWAPFDVMPYVLKAFARGAAAWAAVLQLPFCGSRLSQDLESGMIFKIVSAVSDPDDGATLFAGVGDAARLGAAAGGEAELGTGTEAELDATVAVTVAVGADRAFVGCTLSGADVTGAAEDAEGGVPVIVVITYKIWLAVHGNGEHA